MKRTRKSAKETRKSATAPRKSAKETRNGATAPRKSAKETRKGAKVRGRKLSARLVRQWLRGQKVMNEITQAERRAWLLQLTVEEARQVFDDLHGNADDWKKFGGDMDALERRRIAEKAQGRSVFLRVARRQGLL